MFYVPYGGLTAVFFFIPIVRDFLSLWSDGFVLLTIALAVTWICLLIGLVWEGRVEDIAFMTSVVIAFSAVFVGPWLGGVLGVGPSVGRIALVEGVMLVLAITNLEIGRRRRARMKSQP